MENDKYFTPDIEDLCIGYELEMNWNRAYEEKWVPIKISIQDEEFTYTDEISDIVNALDDGMSEARTAFLTKEQIEAEGWKETISHGVYQKGEFKLGYLWNTEEPPQIWIDYIHFRKYEAECKSINEFRYICKLLKIK
jgi:hypothetical protein